MGNKRVRGSIAVERIELAPLDRGGVQRSGGSEDDRISPDKIYLALIHNHYVLGTFHRQWYGWNFNWFWSAVVGIQLDMIEELYETDLTRRDDGSVLGYEVETDDGGRIKL